VTAKATSQFTFEAFMRVGRKIRSKRYHCPGCGRFVDHETMWCGSCGRDLRLEPLVASVRYQCSLDGMFVKGSDMSCPHCGADIR
jgi:ribosomal protein S27AE